MATYSTWYKGTIDPVQLIRYYRENSRKKPKYIYYETTDFENPNIIPRKINNIIYSKLDTIII